jgi:gliding motility-associated-like protein
MLISLLFQQAAGQCGTTVSNYPYSEGFETTSGNWFSGGTNSDWVWGIPSKPVITAAGAGSKCWIVGGLTNSSYNNGELSWLQSPCFNFSSLQDPQVSFKILWETERKFDGASFQYSTDGGNVWINVGSVNSVSNCLAVNWFNNSSITYLSNGQGWSGNIQSNSGSCLGGSGSGAWLTAKHSIANLAGEPNVIFRFLFGAGTTCNSYDGFAIDDISIAETPPNTADFSYTCGSNKTVSFTDNSSPCVSSYNWDFGDVASGANNFSSSANPVHQFSSGGTYTVTLAVSFAGNLTVARSKTITVLDATTSSSDVKCWGNANGQATVYVTGGNGNYTYAWNTNPVQTTQTISNLIAGNYIATITSTGACATSASVTITQPNKLTDALQVTSEKCSDQKGAVTSNARGGVQPYTYQWSTGSIASSIQDLTAGNYNVTVTDANGCKVSTGVTLPNINNNIQLFLGNDTTICPGEKLTLSTGSFATYAWQDNSTNSNYTVTQTGAYSVKVTDADGCFASDTIKVAVDCSDIYFPSAFTPNNDTKNETFGAFGNLGAVRNYSLKVFGRWGSLVFQTTNPYQHWNGQIKGLGMNAGTFVWFAQYEINNKKKMQKGVFVLIR